MRLLSCLNPKTVTNPYTGEKLTVRCGKCSACLNARSANWVQRLTKEIQDNKYTVFATLQYDEQHVPQMVRLRKEDDTNAPSYIDSLTGEIISLNDDSISHKSQIDYEYCYNTKVLNVHNNVDYPLFMKRLRYYIYELHKSKGKTELAKVRYYAVAEYGPTTYRPHYHILLFSNSPLFAQNFNELISKSWQYGRVYDAHLVDSSSPSSYVASYLNCSSHLPAIYLHKSIRQRSFFSKSPAIGTLAFGMEFIKKAIDSGDTTFRLFNATSRKFDDVPLWRNLQDRAFPRIQRFDSISHSDRVALYRLAETKLFDCSCTEAAQRIIKCFGRNYVASERQNLLGWSDYPSFFREYFHTITFPPTSLLRGIKKFHFKTFCFDSLVRFCRVLNRVAYQATCFGISIEDYVSKIEKYYENKSSSSFVGQLQAQKSYLENNHPFKDLLITNQYFIDSVNGKEVSMLSDSQLYILKYYGVIDDSYAGVISLSIQDSYEYFSLKSTHDKIFWQNTKSKQRNDYLNQHSKEFQSVINYKQSLKNESFKNF